MCNNPKIVMKIFLIFFHLVIDCFLNFRTISLFLSLFPFPSSSSFSFLLQYGWPLLLKRPKSGGGIPRRSGESYRYSRSRYSWTRDSPSGRAGRCRFVIDGGSSVYIVDIHPVPVLCPTAGDANFPNRYSMFCPL